MYDHSLSLHVLSKVVYILSEWVNFFASRLDDHAIMKTGTSEIKLSWSSRCAKCIQSFASGNT